MPEEKKKKLLPSIFTLEPELQEALLDLLLHPVPRQEVQIDEATPGSKAHWLN